MALYLIGYDLKAPGRNYDELYKAIKSLGAWCHPLDSTWIVKHSGPCPAIRDALSPHIDGNDSLLVVALSGPWASFGLSTTVTDWLKNNA